MTYALELGATERAAIALGEAERAYVARTTGRDAYKRAMEACHATRAWAARVDLPEPADRRRTGTVLAAAPPVPFHVRSIALKLASSLAAAAFAALLCGSAYAVDPTVVDFSHGPKGWKGPGRTFIDPRLGNGAPALHTVHEDFGITYTNNRPVFTGDYSVMPSFTFSVDVLTKSIAFSGENVSRDLIVEFRDTDATQGGYPYSERLVRPGHARRPGESGLAAPVGDGR